MYLVKPKNFLFRTCTESKEKLDIKSIQSFDEFSNIGYRQGVVGVSLPSKVLERWAKDRIAMEKRAEQIGVQLKVRVANDDPKEQVAQIEELINEGVDVLVIAPVNSAELIPTIEKARNQGIKIVAYDRLLLGTDVDVYITYSNRRSGEIQGRYLIDKVPKGNYILLSGEPGDNNALLVKEGAMEYIAPRVSLRYINIIADKPVPNWSADEAYKITKEILDTNVKVDAVLAPADKVSDGVVRALTEKGLEHKVVVTGQDAEIPALKRILAGTQNMTVFKDVRELGSEAITIADRLSRNQFVDTDQLINNGKTDVKSILLNPIEVDRSNLEQVIIDSGYYTKEQVYG